MTKNILIAFVLLASAAGIGSAQTVPSPTQTANEIRTEATRKNNDATGRPLPLLAAWHVGGLTTIPGMTPAYQVGMVEKGHHVIPSFGFPSALPDSKPLDEAYIEDRWRAPLQHAAQLQLPITLVSTQWERLLSDDKNYFELPAEKNPNVVTPEGKIENKVSPFGPVELWREVGKKWGGSPLMKRLQEWYPNPPLVILLSNNEHRKLRWQDVETDVRYLAKYGKGRDDNFKRQAVAEGWVERYRALQDGIRSELSKNWQDKSLSVGYNAFGPQAFGRWGGWINYSLYVPNSGIEPSAKMWDGGSPSYYLNDWEPVSDFHVWSVQIQSMNWVFMQKEAWKLNPNFWFEFSVWDGYDQNEEKNKHNFFKEKGQEYTPARYAASTQYGLWLLRPRVLREFRGHTDRLDRMEPWYLALSEIVDRVYENETLKHFWRKGELVPNRAHQHLYQSGIPEEYKNEDRWFLLDTNLDPARPWKLDTQIPVFSLALVEGAAGNRRWLVYAHSPVQDRSDVEITVPGYGKIKVKVPVEGAFYIVHEKNKTVQNIVTG